MNEMQMGYTFVTLVMVAIPVYLLICDPQAKREARIKRELLNADPDATLPLEGGR